MEPGGTPSAEDKKRALARRRWIATGLLALAAAIFATMRALPQSFTVRLAAAAAEAALVGGLADWFAVTAIFRRPLGLPIPHTALIPRRKDALGRALAAFVRDNFLEPPLVLERLRAANRALQLAHWLDSDPAEAFFQARAAQLIPLVLERPGSEQLRAALGSLIREVAARTDLPRLLDVAIDALLAADAHMPLIDLAAELGLSSLNAAGPFLMEKIGAQTGRFVPAYIDRKIAESTLRSLRLWLAAIATGGTEERMLAGRWVRKTLQDIRQTPSYPALLTHIQAMAASPALGAIVASSLDSLRSKLATEAATGDHAFSHSLARGVREAGRILAANAELQETLNSALEHTVVDYIAPWRAGIAAYIAGRVASWDAQTVAEMIELEAGSDLQFVRINGTLVGALIGVVLFLLSNIR